MLIGPAKIEICECAVNATLIPEFAVLTGALVMGARAEGVALGLWGAVGLIVLVVGFGVLPCAIPGEVILLVLTVIMALSAMEVAGGVDFLVRVAERIIRKNPKQVTIFAPLVTYGFTFASGTEHIVYPLLPVIYEVAHESGIRPERPMAIAKEALKTGCRVYDIVAKGWLTNDKLDKLLKPENLTHPRLNR